MGDQAAAILCGLSGRAFSGGRRVVLCRDAKAQEADGLWSAARLRSAQLIQFHHGRAKHLSLNLKIPSLPILAARNGRTFSQTNCYTTRLQRTVCDNADTKIALRANQ